MRKLQKTILLLSLLLVGILLLPKISVLASEERVFDYPIKPGTEEWAEYNHGELVQMLQIPDDILKELSTEELVDIVLDYPYFSDFYFFDTYQKGFETMSSHFNGLIELLKRNDAGACLLSLFKEINLIDNYNKEKDFNLISRIAIIMAQKEVVKKLYPSEVLELYEIMGGNSNLQARIEDDFNLFTHVFFSSVKQQDIQPFMGITYEYTPNGSALLCYIFEDGDYDAGADNYIYYVDYISNTYPNATIVDTSTSRYNCHSYAWFNRQSNLWLNDPSPYWLDGSYSQVISSSLGDKIFYTGSNNEHSGIILIGDRVISKWGPGPLVQHSKTGCPYYYAPLSEPWRYYRR